MNKKVLAGLMVGLLGASAAQALVIDRVPGYFGGDGGEFNIKNTPYGAEYINGVTLINGGIETFCLERSEYVGTPATYSYATPVGVNAIFGGGIDHGTVNGSDTISAGSAWLYRNFAKGTLTGADYNYDYTPGSGRSASAWELQNAFWSLEQEVPSLLGGGNQFYNAAVAALGSDALARANVTMDLSNGIDTAHGVRALNLIRTDALGVHHYQSQLILDADGNREVGTPVTDGGLTLLLLGASLAGIPALRRRLAK